MKKIKRTQKRILKFIKDRRIKNNNFKTMAWKPKVKLLDSKSNMINAPLAVQPMVDSKLSPEDLARVVQYMHSIKLTYF